MENNDFIDKCKLLGIYNDKDVYLYISSKYKSARIFILQIIIIFLNGVNLINQHLCKQ